MKKGIKYAIAGLLAIAGLTACDNELAEAPVILPEGGVGTGTWDNPMTAYQCLLGCENPDLDEVWVTGYIVGIVNTNVGNVYNERSAQFTGPFSVVSNIVLALDPNETDWEKCTTVQLPSGPVRKALNLSDNPDNLGQQVTIKGTTGIKYCGVYGLKECSAYNWGDKGIEEAEPEELPGLEGPYFYWDFNADSKMENYYAQGWTNVATAGGLSGWYLKTFNDLTYLTVSAYLGSETGGPYDNWLITPAIQLDKFPTKTIEFETQAAYAAEGCYLEVVVMTSNEPLASNNTVLEATVATPPASGYSSWVSTGQLDLSKFSGTIYIGWHYHADKGGKNNSATYCLNNINLGNAPGHGSTDNPDTPDTPGTGDASVIYSDLLETSATCNWTFDNVLLPEGKTSIWSWKEYNGKYYLYATAYSGDTAPDSEAYAYSPAVSLEGYTSVYVSFDQAAKFQNSIKDLCKFVVREAGTSEWTVFEIPQWPEAGSWNFSNSGTIDVSAFAGKNVEFGFKYASNSKGADTWEIRNFEVKAK